jgi:integrase
VLGDRPIGEIRRSEIVRLIDGIEDSRGPRAAGLALTYLSKLFNWHASRDDDFVSPVVRGMSRPKRKPRDRVLTDEEIRTLWAGAEDVFGRYLRFLLLTAVRRSEAASMMRAELDGAVWTIPAERMKSKVEHVVPLSPTALAIVAGQGEGPVFTIDGVRPIKGFSSLKQNFDEVVPLSKPWTLHDLRRTARSLMSRAGVSADIAERCLAHVIPGVRGVYGRHAYLEEKRQAFEALAGLVQRIVDPQPNVVAMKR